jgi:hypothetical protein
MRDKVGSIPCRRLVKSAATVATMLLAAGAKWKP